MPLGAELSLALGGDVAASVASPSVSAVSFTQPPTMRK
jgi:hypothetical protein